MTNSLLNPLWKSATTPPDGKYENLVGKQCRFSGEQDTFIMEAVKLTKAEDQLAISYTQEGEKYLAVVNLDSIEYYETLDKISIDAV